MTKIRLSQDDVLIVGAGLAGLLTALHLAPRPVTILTAGALGTLSSSAWAQGGVAAAVGPDDSTELHVADTLAAGAGLCDPDAVRRIVEAGPAAIETLARYGTRFDRDADGALRVGLEAAHSRRRIVHATGDGAGREIVRALVAAVQATPSITVLEGLSARRLLMDVGQVCGVLAQRRGESVVLRASRVVLATGGVGGLFRHTTNPSGAYGAGIAMAALTGAALRGMEFVQFHPTALWLGPGARGQQPLVSEAMRGEGAVLVDARGERVMVGAHPLEDLAPRDVVAKQMARVMAAQETDHLFLDARGLGETLLLQRFPTIVARCRAAGVDPVTRPIPVSPAAHYASGGVVTDLRGRTAVPGLWACGEVACTGVHGANRLASNSLLEGLVFAARIGADLAGGLPPPVTPAADDRTPGLVAATAREDLQAAMTAGAGVLRSAASLDAAAKALASLPVGAVPGPQAWETTDLHTVASALVAAARLREETRGAHWREDFPVAVEAWRVHLVSTLGDDGGLATAGGS